MANDLLMPFAGSRNTSSSPNYQTTHGDFWSSSPTGTGAYYLVFNSSLIIVDDISNRANGVGVRCFKNTPPPEPAVACEDASDIQI
jgi:hypothetical protein